MRAQRLVVSMLLALAPCGAAGQSPTDRALAGRKLLLDGEFVEAARQLEKACPAIAVAYGARHPYHAFCLDDLGQAELGAGRTADALKHAGEAEGIVAAVARHTPEHAVILANQASVLVRLGRLGEAEPPLRVALKLLRRDEGEASQRTIRAARNLAVVLQELRRPAEARTLFEAARAGLGKANASAGELAALDAERVGPLLELGEIDAAAGVADSAIRALEALQPAPSAELAAALTARARVAGAAGDLALAEILLAEALQLTADGPRLGRAQALYALGNVQILRRQALEAETTYRDVAGLYRAELGENHPAMARLAHQLALVYAVQQREEESRRYWERAIAIAGEALGSSSLPVAETRTEYAATLARNGFAGPAIEQAEAALAIYARLPSAPALRRALASSALGSALQAANRLDDARAVFNVAVAGIEQADGSHSPHLPPGLVALAEIDLRQGRPAEAEPRLGRAIAIYEAAGARTIEALGQAQKAMADVALALGDPDRALAAIRAASAIAAERLALAGTELGAAGQAERRQARLIFERHLAIASSQANDPAVVAELGRVAQLPHLTGTAAAVSRMAARLGGGDDRLAEQVRARESAAEAYLARDQLLVAAMAAGQARRASELQRELSELAQDIKQRDAALAREFPGYAELVRADAIDAGDLQEVLRGDEALALQVTDAEGSTLVLIRPDRVKVARTNLDQQRLTQLVQRLRVQLQFDNTPNLLGSVAGAFDFEAAYEIYQGLFEPLEASLMEVAHLVLVLDGAMQSLPPGLLLTRPPASAPATHAEMGRQEFLIRRHAISVLPSASALVRLRQQAGSSHGAEPFLGFGDPQFGTGDGKMTREVVDVPQLVDPAGQPIPSGWALVPRLANTRPELQAIARSLDADEGAVHVGPAATEAAVKRAALDRYRVLAFATHGLLAEETAAAAHRDEPALLLTPPERATALEDGVLTASEIGQLSLDADWVLLLACNTASSSGKPGAEGLSGLARAFFYAGSRALLVSHWPVETFSAQALSTSTMHAFVGEDLPGRAEALRQAMLALLEGRGEPYWAHPIFWAPFVVVGEGAG